MSIFQKQQQNHKACNDSERYGPYPGTKINNTILEKDQTMDILDRDFKMTILEMFKEPK